MGIKKVLKLPGVKILKNKDGLKHLEKALEDGRQAIQEAVTERQNEQKKVPFNKLYIGPDKTNPNRKKNGLPKVLKPPFIDPETSREIKANQKAREENSKRKGGGTYKK